MGCGKSSVGRKLSQLLCCPFMDLDDMIEAEAGKSIPEIFAEIGESGFRQIFRRPPPTAELRAPPPTRGCEDASYIQ